MTMEWPCGCSAQSPQTRYVQAQSMTYRWASEFFSLSLATGSCHIRCSPLRVFHVGHAMVQADHVAESSTCGPPHRTHATSCLMLPIRPHFNLPCDDAG